jgi:hypothetical protein
MVLLTLIEKVMALVPGIRSYSPTRKAVIANSRFQDALYVPASGSLSKKTEYAKEGAHGSSQDVFLYDGITLSYRKTKV